MSSRNKGILVIGFALVAPLLMADAAAQKLFQPPGANLTYGDVTHGMRVQSASTNPAAAAADMARQSDEAKSGGMILDLSVHDIDFAQVQRNFFHRNGMAGKLLGQSMSTRQIPIRYHHPPSALAHQMHSG